VPGKALAAAVAVAIAAAVARAAGDAMATAVAAPDLNARASEAKEVARGLVTAATAAASSSKVPQWNGFSWVVLGAVAILALEQVLAARDT
jgi:hypothetical protein